MNETYKPGYSNSNSAEFKTFGTNLCQTVGEYLNTKLDGYRGCEVKGLTSGSVVEDMQIMLAESSDVTASLESLAQALNAGTDASEMGYTIIGNVSVNATDQ